MDASASTAEMPFARNKILATLLRACGEKTARHAFAIQVELLGSTWISQFFDGFAQYIRQHVCVNVDTRLINAYVDVVAIPKITLSIKELLKQPATRQTLGECVIPFELRGAPEAATKQMTNIVNDHIAKRRTISGPQVSKITEYQVCSFLTLLPQENEGLRSGRSERPGLS